MSGIPVYGANHSWSQYPLDTQPQLPINSDFTYESQQQSHDSIFSQEAYPSQYPAQYLPPSAGSPPQRQFSNPSSVVSSNQSIDQSFYTTLPQTQTHPTYDTSSPTYLGSSFDISGNSNTALYSASPQRSTSLLSEALGSDGIAISSPSQSFYSVPSVAAQSTSQYYQTPTVATNATTHVQNQNQKRHRGPDQANDQDHVVVEDEGTSSAEQNDSGMKPKPAACTRCKSLKVKCEMKTETDPCKRCLSTGNPCLTPNKKPRRTPPKREHLMSQIREQATHIQQLMGQIQILMAELETRNDRSSPPNRTSSTFGTDLDPTSPLLLSSFELSDSHHQLNSSMSPEVQEWINKAKESIEAFGQFVGMDSAAIAKSLVDENPEDDDSSDDDVVIVGEEDAIIVDDSNDQDGSHVAIAVEHSDGEVVESTEWSKINISDASQGSSNSSNGVLTPQGKKKELSAAQKLTAIPAKTSPWGLMAEMSTRKKNLSRKGSQESSDDVDLGVAHQDFFCPSPTPDMMDNLLSQNIVTPQEVEKLFNIYFDYMNISLSLLDPVLYTAKQTYYRSSFLFTVICAIASRYYTERPDLYPQLMRYAQQAAGRVLVYGKKSVEVCHAYILLSLFPIATRRWEDDRSWIYLGLAIRFATDLNLHHPFKVKPENEYQAREVLNRERLWLNCFNLDRSMGSQYGKSPIIRNTDYIACHSENWWRSSPFNMSNFDIHLCAYNAELRVMSAFSAQIYNDPNHPTGLNRDVDFEKLAAETDDQLVQLSEKWFAVLAETDMTDQQNHFRSALLRLGYSYARLIALSFGFQHHFSKNHTVENPFLQRCLRAASDVVTAIVDDIASLPNQRVYLRHGPEAQSVFVTFAAAFLVKLLQPKFASYLDTEKRQNMRTLVKKAIDHLGSVDIAVDNRHGPKLYARFLEGLLATPMAKVDGPKRNESITHKKIAQRPKSASSQSPEPEQHLDVPAATASTPQVVSQTARSTPSPRPSRASLSFDLFAPILAGSDPFAPASVRVRSGAGGIERNLGGMTTSTDFFQQPSFDDNLLQSMQSLPADDALMWDMNQTGFDWMSELQNLGSTFTINQYTSQ